MDVVLFSGGVDSLTTTLMLQKAKREFKVMYVDMNHLYAAQELRAVYDLVDMLNLRLEKFEVEGVNKYENLTTMEIPYRNDLLIMLAALSGGEEIFLSVEQGSEVNISKDRSEEFIQRLNRYFEGRAIKVSVVNLVAEDTKEDEIRWILGACGEKRGKELLEKTFSCYNPRFLHSCGNCPACMRWYLAAVGAGLEEEFVVKRFERDIEATPLFREYLKRTKEGLYTGKRGEQYKKVFEKLGYGI